MTKNSFNPRIPSGPETLRGGGSPSRRPIGAKSLSSAFVEVHREFVKDDGIIKRPLNANGWVTARLMRALTAIPVSPGFFNGLIQTITVIGTKRIPIAFFV